MTARKFIAAGLCYSCLLSQALAQQASIEPVRPSTSWFLRPYQATEVPPIRVQNTGRLGDLVRAGILYLTAQDAIALALENNIDLEIARYNPFSLQWRLERAQAGGALPGVPSGASQAGSVASGQGVAGSQSSAGVTSAAGGGTAGAVGNATVTQIGPVTQTLDPTVQEATTFSHKTAPQPNSTQSNTPVLITNTRVSTASVQEGFLTGGSVTGSFGEHYLNENAPSDLLNPSVAPNIAISFQHNLLRGFGVAVNSRSIEAARINLNSSDLNFRTQVIIATINVLNAYYSLVADDEDVKAKRSALELAKTLFEDNKKQVEIGTLAPLDLTTAQAQIASASRDLVISDTSRQQHEVQLKNLISRAGIADPALANVQIMPLDRIVIPSEDNLPPLKELVQKATANRADLAAERAAVTSAQISALGTRNGILPSLVAFGGDTQAGLAGRGKTATIQGHVISPDLRFVGGLGTALSQVFSPDFPSARIGAFFQAPIHNLQAQADYGIDQLQLRQQELTTRKDHSQAEVDVLNAVVALRQARARYEAAVQNRILDERLLDAEQKKFGLGASTPYAVIQQQRDLSVAQSTEIAAEVSYSSARIALDQTTGATLEANNISISDAKAGRVSRPSVLPATLPDRP